MCGTLVWLQTGWFQDRFSHSCENVEMEGYLRTNGVRIVSRYGPWGGGAGKQVCAPFLGSGYGKWWGGVHLHVFTPLFVTCLMRCVPTPLCTPLQTPLHNPWRGAVRGARQAVIIFVIPVDNQ